MTETLVMEIPNPVAGTTVIIKGTLDDYGEGGMSIDVNTFTRIRIPLSDEQEENIIELFNNDEEELYWENPIEVETVVDDKGNLEFKSIKLAE